MIHSSRCGAALVEISTKIDSLSPSFVATADYYQLTGSLLGFFVALCVVYIDAVVQFTWQNASIGFDLYKMKIKIKS